MHSLYHIHYSVRDRLLRAWEDSMELVRKLETFSHETEEGDVASLFSELAEDEALVAAKLFEVLRKNDE